MIDVNTLILNYQQMKKEAKLKTLIPIVMGLHEVNLDPDLVFNVEGMSTSINNDSSLVEIGRYKTYPIMMDIVYDGIYLYSPAVTYKCWYSKDNYEKRILMVDATGKRIYHDGYYGYGYFKTAESYNREQQVKEIEVNPGKHDYHSLCQELIEMMQKHELTAIKYTKRAVNQEEKIKAIVTEHNKILTERAKTNVNTNTKPS